MKPSELDPERWREIDRLLDEALDHPPGERSVFLAEACAGDDELRSAVEELLEAHEAAGNRFDEPVRALAEVALSSGGPSRAPGGGEREHPEDVEGREVGPFRLVREIGRGGMGVVYLAEDVRLGRRVALKALPPYLGVGDGARARFLSEARAISALDHPNVATLHESDVTDDGQPYMVFAYYEGETLEERIGRGPLPVDEAVEIARAVTAGLGAAHGRGIVHRDVKPSNVLLGVDGGVRLLDFGVAKVAGEELTSDGARLGTVAYMSPEQARGEPLDGRSDLWSVGVVLYEMLTGRRPFGGGDPVSTLRSIVEDTPTPPSRMRKGVTPALEAVLAGLLAKEPADRYAGCGALLADLDGLVAGGSGDVRPAGRASSWARRVRPSRGRGRAASARRTIAVVAVAAVLAVGAWAAREAGAPAAGIDRLAVLPLVDLTGDSTLGHVVQGMGDALAQRLGEDASVDVVSLASVAAVRELGLARPELGARLGADALLEGSVTARGDSLTVVMALIGLSPERRVWAQSVSGAAGAPVELMGRVAEAVVVTLTDPSGRSRSVPAVDARPVSPRAYDAYLRARLHMGRGSPEAFALAERYLEQAIALDSTFAAAYVELAEVRGRAAFFGLRDPNETVPGMIPLLQRALRIDSASALAHRRWASVHLYWNRDPAAAERSALRALELNPSLSEAYFQLSEIMAVRGDYDRALAYAERGTELAPWEAFPAARPALTLYYGGEFEAAVERVDRVIEFFPEFWQGYVIRCWALVGAGRLDEAAEACQEAVARSGGVSMARGSLGYVHAVRGDREAAAGVLRALEEPADGRYVAPTHVAWVHAGLGDADRALAWLERAYEERDLGLVHLRQTILLSGLRADARFAALLERMGLEEDAP